MDDSIKDCLLTCSSEIIDESHWNEVRIINSYALFMGYISMAIKGLAFLMLTWTTVVLLGGFVTMLQLKDFWCLTFITLVQTTGIFDVHQNEKFSYIAKSAWGLVLGTSAILGNCIGCCTHCGIAILVANFILMLVVVLVHMLTFAILVCPLAAIYVFGLLISTGISIWRLIQHDYGGDSDGESNLKPAMDTLYYLALLQGALFCYRFLFGLTKKELVKQMIREYGTTEEGEVVLRYLRETRIGCEKDPSFSKGRNLITHAIELMGSKSHDECVSGVKMLYTAICMGEKRLEKERVQGPAYSYRSLWKYIIGQHMMMKNIIISAPSSPVLQKLLQTLNPRGAFDRETRNQGATIVSHLALEIYLEQYPWAIQYIYTLIGSFEEYRLIEPYLRDQLVHKYDQDWNQQASRLPSPGNDDRKLIVPYEKLVLTGLCILWKLATHENNCRIMIQTQGLLPKLMAPLTSDMIHKVDNGKWSTSVVAESMKVMFQLVAAHGETGAKLRRIISSSEKAISTMWKIINCPCCHVNLQKRAMGVLIQLYMGTANSGTYIKMLVDIFTNENKNRSIRELAGKGLAKLSIQGGSSTSIILQMNGNVVGSLTKILLLDDAENKKCRIRAAEILEQMCIHHNKDDESLGKLKKDMVDTMPKVLAQILGSGLMKDETAGQIEADLPEKEIDIENPFNIPKDNAEDDTTFFLNPHITEDKGEVEAEVEMEMDMEVDEVDNEEDEEFHAPLLSLFVTIYDVFISGDEDLSSEFRTVYAISLPKKLKEMVADNNIMTVHCVRLMKLTCKMVISMMKHRGSYLKEDLENLMGALSAASESMSLIDISMLFASEDEGAATTMEPFRSLGSLVKEATASVETYFKTQESSSEN